MALLFFSSAFELTAEPTNNKSGASYASFDVIARRNIFNPNQHAYQPPQPPAPPADTFALVGTMSYSKGKFAFFNGTKTDYKKVLGPGATIAGYTIKDVTLRDVTLVADGKELNLTVGSQMTK